MPSDKELKEKLRKLFLERRGQLSNAEVVAKSRVITNRLLKLDLYKYSDFLHTYVSIEKNNEVETRDLIKTSFDAGKQVAVPKMVSGNQLKHFRIHALSDLEENYLQIPEPAKGIEISHENIDLIIVPMVAGDTLKNRIGYGAGYYDRFLEKSSATKVGLLFDCQLSDHTLPTEDFDIKLDILLTESKIID